MSCRGEHTNTGKPCLLSTEANAGRKILFTLQTKRKPWDWTEFNMVNDPADTEK